MIKRLILVSLILGLPSLGWAKTNTANLPYCTPTQGVCPLKPSGIVQQNQNGWVIFDNTMTPGDNVTYLKGPCITGNQQVSCYYSDPNTPIGLGVLIFKGPQ